MLGAPPEGLLVPGKTHVTTWKQDATKYAATHHWPSGTTGQGVQGDREGHGRAPHTRSTFSRRRSRLDTPMFRHGQLAETRSWFMAPIQLY